MPATGAVELAPLQAASNDAVTKLETTRCKRDMN